MEQKFHNFTESRVTKFKFIITNMRQNEVTINFPKHKMFLLRYLKLNFKSRPKTLSSLTRKLF